MTGLEPHPHAPLALELVRLSCEGDSPPISRDTASLALSAWNRILQAIPEMPLPRVEATEEKACFTWLRGADRLELFVGTGGRYFWASTEPHRAYDGIPWPLGRELPAKAMERLRAICANPSAVPVSVQ